MRSIFWGARVTRANVPFWDPLKTSENLFSDVFRGSKKGTLAKYELNQYQISINTCSRKSFSKMFRRGHCKDFTQLTYLRLVFVLCVELSQLQSIYPAKIYASWNMLKYIVKCIHYWNMFQVHNKNTWAIILTFHCFYC